MNIAALLLSIIIFLAIRARVRNFFLDEYEENVSKMQIKRIVVRRKV